MFSIGAEWSGSSMMTVRKGTSEKGSGVKRLLPVFQVTKASWFFPDMKASPDPGRSITRIYQALMLSTPLN